jgi:hypothetical protein
VFQSAGEEIRVTAADLGRATRMSAAHRQAVDAATASRDVAAVAERPRSCWR